jgi:hypothetical protein
LRIDNLKAYIKQVLLEESLITEDRISDREKTLIKEIPAEVVEPIESKPPADLE